MNDPQNTPCEFADCTHRYHDPKEDSSRWRHEIFVAKDFGGVVEAAISVYSNGMPPVGDICVATDHDLMTAADYRRIADEYEAFPVWLRALADRMDALER